MGIKLSFHGGAREVTGACYLLENARSKILIDCGLFQGCEECADMNFTEFKFKPSAVDAVFVTHAHLDHVGRLPKLVKDGFSGNIYSTAPTRDLAAFILEDALRIAKRENHGQNELYTQEHLQKTMRLWKTSAYGEEIAVGDATAKIAEGGHILGSGMLKISFGGNFFLFTGDLGGFPSTLLPSPESPEGTDYLIIESAYGNKTHESLRRAVSKLERAAEDATSSKGVLLIPAFATERTQDILFHLNEMLVLKRVPEIPVFVDSPLASRITGVYAEYPEMYRPEIRDLLRQHPNLFRSKKLRFAETVEESKAINDVPPPKVIIAGSSSMQGGRILHHARRYLSDKNSILLIVGYQASGSLGRRIADGAETVKIFGENVAVKAEVRKISGFSAHADSRQLFSFVETCRDTLKKVFVVQGEEAQSLHFMQEIKDRLGIPSETPRLYQEFEI